MKVIGIDLDGTLAEYVEWQGVDIIGQPYKTAPWFLHALKERGWVVCIWTTRADIYVRKWLEEHNLIQYIDFINDSPYPCEAHKRSFDVYIGDEAIRFEGEFYELFKNLHTDRHWGSEGGFDRDVVESDRNPELYLRGTSKTYLDMFDGLTESIWRLRRRKARYAFLTICSHAKPYSKSWIHCEIRKLLHNQELLQSLDYIHISNAGIIPHEASGEEAFSIVNRYDWNGAEADPAVTELLRKRITQRLASWYRIAGIKYEKIFVYLRPSGNTMQAVKASQIPAIFIPVRELDSPEWMDLPDVDDCLANPINTQLIVTSFQGFALNKGTNDTP